MRRIPETASSGNQIAPPGFPVGAAPRFPFHGEGDKPEPAESAAIAWPGAGDLEVANLDLRDRSGAVRKARYDAYDTWEAEALRLCDAEAPAVAAIICAIRRSIHWDTGEVKASAGLLAERAGQIEVRKAERCIGLLALWGMVKREGRNLRLALPTSYSIDDRVAEIKLARSRKLKRVAKKKAAGSQLNSVRVSNPPHLAPQGRYCDPAHTSDDADHVPF